MTIANRILAILGVLGAAANGFAAESIGYDSGIYIKPDSVRYIGEVLDVDVFQTSKPQFRMHTDVPDLPDRMPDIPIDFGFDSESPWTPGHLAPGKPVVHYFGDELDLVRRLFEEVSGPEWIGGVLPGQVHTDVPDLPDFIYPNLSVNPIRKPGWDDFSNAAGGESRPQLESMTIPVPSTLFVFGIAGYAASRRRRG